MSEELSSEEEEPKKKARLLPFLYASLGLTL
jgi:hypothetical protein